MDDVEVNFSFTLWFGGFNETVDNKNMYKDNYNKDNRTCQCDFSSEEFDSSDAFLGFTVTADGARRGVGLVHTSNVRAFIDEFRCFADSEGDFITELERTYSFYMNNDKEDGVGPYYGNYCFFCEEKISGEDFVQYSSETVGFTCFLHRECAGEVADELEKYLEKNAADVVRDSL